MKSEIHPADWTIPYPEKCDAESIPLLLHSLTHVEHEWDAFPWHLAEEMAGHIQEPDSTFDYLHLTTFFRARAAMLALGDDVLDHGDLFGALSKHRVQVGGIYRAHLLKHVNEYLDQKNLKRFPVCTEGDPTAVYDRETAANHRIEFQNVIRIVENEYLKTLDFISVASSMDEEVAGHSVGYWAKGAEIPTGRSVRVRARRQDGKLYMRPAQDEVKRLIQADRPRQKILMKLQGELTFSNAGFDIWNEEHRKVGPAACDASGIQPSSCASERSEDGKPVVNVIGDFKVIVLGVGRKMNLARKHKRRAFLRAVHRRCTATNEDTFYWQNVVEDHNAEFPGPHQLNRRIRSDRLDDIFKGQKAEFRELFEILDRASGHLRLKVKFSTLLNMVLALPILGAEDVLAVVEPLLSR